MICILATLSLDLSFAAEEEEEFSCFVFIPCLSVKHEKVCHSHRCDDAAEEKRSEDVNIYTDGSTIRGAWLSIQCAF